MNTAFVEEIRNTVAEVLNDKIVEVKEVEKTNGVKRTGILIRTEGVNIAPTIYISDNMSVNENVEAILDAYKQTAVENIDASFYTDYENVKNRLSIMLTSKPRKELAKRKAPGFDDLYMHACVVIEDSAIGKGHIKVTKDHLKNWGISNARLFSDALKSAPNVSPAKRIGMFDMLKEMGIPGMGSEDEGPMDVLTTQESVFGAAAILYTKVSKGTYMIPSSVHEVILVNVDGANGMTLNEMINDVNRSCVAPEDFLNNHAYRYNGKKWENID